MSWSPLHTAMIHVRQRGAAAMAAALIYAGISEIISILKYRIVSVTLRLINEIIIRGFRDRLLLPDYGGVPWWFDARNFAMAVILIVLGTLLGVWVNRRSQRESAH